MTTNAQTERASPAAIAIMLALMGGCGWCLYDAGTGRRGEFRDLVHQCYEWRRAGGAGESAGRWSDFGTCEEDANRAMIERYGRGWRDDD